ERWRLKWRKDKTLEEILLNSRQLEILKIITVGKKCSACPVSRFRQVLVFQMTASFADLWIVFAVTRRLLQILTHQHYKATGEPEEFSTHLCSPRNPGTETKSVI
ncbi:hypothetical protein ACROYT_G019702, partial [Oculina patagonica]